MMSGAERGESPDAASKSIRHSTSQELQWKNSVPFMIHSSSSPSNVSRFPTNAEAPFVSGLARRSLIGTEEFHGKLTGLCHNS